MPKQKTLKQLKKKLDEIFSKYIRLRKARKGVVQCVTCNKFGYWKEMQCGHYVSRTHLSTRFDERNCNVQCVGCNVFKKGNMDEYALYMKREYGEGILEELNKLKHKSRKITRAEYQEKIQHYKDLIKDDPYLGKK